MIVSANIVLKLFECWEILYVFVICWFFSKLIFWNNSFAITIRVPNSLNLDQARRSVRSDLGPNCLQRLSADDTSRQTDKSYAWWANWPSSWNYSKRLENMIMKLSLCLLGNFACFFVVCSFFQSQLFGKILSGIPLECQTVWIQIRPDILSGLIWVQTVCKGNNISRRHQ